MFEQSEVQGEGPFCRCLGEALKAFLNRSFEVGTDTCEGNENRSISTEGIACFVARHLNPDPRVRS